MNTPFLCSFMLLNLGVLQVAHPQEPPAATIRAGMIGLDTSHVPAFARIFNHAGATSELAVDRIRRQTSGASDILLFTTCPASSRWETMKELEQAAIEAAQEKGVAVADIAARFRRIGSAEQALQQSYWAWDKTHLGTNGHRLVAATVLKALTATD